jgi:hypothetical protein
MIGLTLTITGAGTTAEATVTVTGLDVGYVDPKKLRHFTGGLYSLETGAEGYVADIDCDIPNSTATSGTYSYNVLTGFNDLVPGVNYYADGTLYSYGTNPTTTTLKSNTVKAPTPVTPTNPPTAPTFTLTSTSTTITATVTNSATNKATSYNYSLYAHDGDKITGVTTSATSYQFFGLAYGTEYDVIITSINADGTAEGQRKSIATTIKSFQLLISGKVASIYIGNNQKVPKKVAKVATG